MSHDAKKLKTSTLKKKGCVLPQWLSGGLTNVPQVTKAPRLQHYNNRPTLLCNSCSTLAAQVLRSALKRSIKIWRSACSEGQH
eukprot:454478-Pelagomonas_calceolata.AAC.1